VRLGASAARPKKPTTKRRKKTAAKSKPAQTGKRRSCGRALSAPRRPSQGGHGYRSDRRQLGRLRWRRFTVDRQRFELCAQAILRHGAGFVQRLALGRKAGDGRERDNEAAILFMMDQKGLSRCDLEPAIGSCARVAEILNRERALTLPMIRALSRLLDLPADVLMQAYEVKRTV
jgi:hypothetical protein